MSKKFLTKQKNNIQEYGIQIRDDNPSTPIENQPYFNKTTKQLKLKTTSSNYIVGETNRTLQLNIVRNIITVNNAEVFTLDVSTLLSSERIHRSTIFDGSMYAETDYTQNTSSISISMWVKFDDTITSHSIFSYPKNVVDSFNLKYSATQFILTKNSETANYSASLDNQWHHLVATYDETNGSKLYIDGDLVTSSNADGALAASGVLSIGTVDGVGDHLVGSLANVQVWSKELNSEPFLLYKRGYTQDVSFVTGFDNNDLKANYGMGDGNKYLLKLIGFDKKTQLLISNSTKTPVIVGSDDSPLTSATISASNRSQHSLALKPDGRVFSWGAGFNGQLGDNTTVDKSVPVQVVSNNDDFVAISGGANHSLALKADGRVFAWGRGTQLGDNTIINKSAPVQVVNQSDFVAISAGNDHSLALKADGRVFSWGDGFSGRLGDNTNVSKSAPVQVVNESDFVAVAAGFEHSLALKADGRVFAWGRGFGGQLGDNTGANKFAPVQVVNESDFVAIAAGEEYSLALKADGRVFAWGVGADGRLGNNSSSNRFAPVQVVNQSDFVAIAAGATHSLALKADGRVFSWGRGFGGRLGDNTEVNKSIPVQVVNQSDFVAIAGGGGHSLALKADGRVFSWGVGFSGRLGDNTVVNKSAPVQVQLQEEVLTYRSLSVDSALDSVNSVINSNQTRLDTIVVKDSTIITEGERFTNNSFAELLDETSNGNTLELSSLPSYKLDLPAIPGIFVSSIFDNTTYLTTTLQNFNLSFSFSAWVKFDPSDTTQQIFKIGNFELYLSGTAITLKKGTVISGTATFDLSNPANQGWNHFVATWYYDGPATGEIFLYRNGVQVIGSTALNDDGGFGNAISGAFDLGANTSDSNFRFLGKIANVEIWSTELTLANAFDLHGAGYYISPKNIVALGLVNHYLMGDNIFDVYDNIKDLEGNSNLETVDGLLMFDKNDLP